MRAFLGVLAALLLVGVLVGVGTTVYNEGVSAGLEQAAATDGEVRESDSGSPYINPSGFGISTIVGFLFSVLLVVIIIGLARAAFGIGRHGHGGPGAPGGWGDRRDRIEEWHREMHRRDGGNGEQTAAGA